MSHRFTLLVGVLIAVLLALSIDTQTTGPLGIRQGLAAGAMGGLVAIALRGMLGIALHGAVATALRSLARYLDRLSARMLARHGIGVRTREEDRYWSLFRSVRRG